MKKLLPFLLLILIVTGCTQPQEQSPSYRQITMEEAAELMAKEGGYVILDVRTVEEYRERHIPNAVNLPNEEIGTEQIDLLPNKDQLILVYCRSGRRSKEASEKLVKLGYTNVVEFGGILDWKGEAESGDR